MSRLIKGFASMFNFDPYEFGQLLGFFAWVILCVGILIGAAFAAKVLS